MSEIILFDLDGTLTDSAEGITKSVQYALTHFGIRINDLKTLECFVGPPLKEQFMQFCNFSEEEAAKAVEFYRERYSAIGLYENRPYDGIYEMLELLRSHGKILAVASSKPECFVKEILKHFDLAKYFAVVVGSELDGKRTRKADVIEEALRRLNCQEHRECVLMVGDRSYDVEGAKECGLQCIGAAFGYGSREELQKAGAVYIAQKVEDLSILVSVDKEEKQEQARILPDQKWYPVKKQKQENLLIKIWRVLYPIGIHYLITLAATIGIEMLWIMARMRDGIDLQTEREVQELVWEMLNKTALITTGIGGFLTIPVTAWLFKKDEAKREHRGKWLNAGNLLVTALLAVSVSHLLNILIILLNLSEIFPSYQDGLGAIMEAQSPWTLLIVVGIIAPIVEELIFRGLVQKRIRDYLGAGWAVLLSALCFGIYHGNMIQFIYAAFLGILFALLHEKTGSLWIPITAHIAANLWSCFADIILSPLAEVLYGGLIIIGGQLVLAILSASYIFGHKNSARNI